MRGLPCHPLLRLCLPALATFASLAAWAADTQAPLPAWKVLEYEQQAFLVTASSRVEIVQVGDNPGRLRLKAASSVASNSENVVLGLDARDGHALRRTRLSRGKQERFKTWNFLPEHIARERRDPPAGATLPPCKWPLTGTRDIAYPSHAEGVPVTDAYALLLLAGRFLASAETATEVIVNTDLNFYRVEMHHSEGTPVEANYQVAGASAATSGSRQTDAVTLQVSPLGEQPDKPDFSLLGLYGEITILFDQATGLPLQLRGTAPRIGSAEINLKAVTLREPPA